MALRSRRKLQRMSGHSAGAGFPRVIACTIATESHLPHANVLAQSFAEHHPGFEFEVLNLDSDPLRLDLRPRELLRMAGIYSPKQLAVALKPLLIRRCLSVGADVVLYLDSDMQVLAPLDLAIEQTLRHGILLTPHMTLPDARLEPWFLRGGAFNAGFIGATQRAEKFLHWWAARTMRHAIHAPEAGYLGDQRWLDLAPAMYDVGVLRDPGYNVMVWNLHERQIRAGPPPTANGRPLCVFHFCGGFDPFRPGLLGTMRDVPWPDLERHPAVAELCRGYADRLLAEGYEAARARVPRFARFEDGSPIDPFMRRAYRDALLEAEHAGSPEPPNPLEDGRAFTSWLEEPLDSFGLNRYLVALWRARVDLTIAFPAVPGEDSARFMEWVRGEPANEQSIPLRYRESAPLGVCAEASHAIDQAPGLDDGERVGNPMHPRGLHAA